jgi:hypothetical protein
MPRGPYVGPLDGVGKSGFLSRKLRRLSPRAFGVYGMIARPDTPCINPWREGYNVQHEYNRTRQYIDIHLRTL